MNETTRAILEIKRALRARWTRPMADDQKRHARLRRRATELLVLRAHARGRLHVRHIPRAWGSSAGDDFAVWHARVVERLAKEYAPLQEAPHAEGTR